MKKSSSSILSAIGGKTGKSTISATSFKVIRVRKFSFAE
jgi:hypothetical protein